MKNINKRFPLLKNIVLASVILLNIFAVCFVRQSNDYNNESLLNNASENSESDLIKSRSTEIIWRKAGISEYSIFEDYQEIEALDSVAETTSSTTAEATASETQIKAVETVVPDTTNQITDETFTVYDLNAKQNVTLNGYDLVCQIVRNEVGAHYTSGAKKGQTAYDEETIKAFAVAAYTYVKYNVNKGQTPSVGLSTDMSQALRDYVAEVYGQAIYYNNSYICAVYCASTGGTTLSSKNSWGKANPYLVSVESIHDSQGKQYQSTKSFTADEIRTIIESKTNIKLSDTPENWFRVAATVDGNYISQLIIDGNSTCTVNGKECSITGTFFRNSILGTSNLKSPDFTVEYIDGMFNFTSYGYGHGVGMPAEGAQLYATIDNWTYIQILQHYYTGVQIS